MKLSTSLFLAATIAASGALGNAWAQTTTSTVTVVQPAAPALIVNPAPAVVVSPPPAVSSTTTTTESTTTENSAEEPGALGEAVSGNTTIIFKPADTRDIHMDRLQTWDDFAQAHPRIASTLAYKPWLINDSSYLNRHPSLDAFFQSHPDIREAMAADPGNFAAIPPRPGE